jgi:hypothetical protein
MKKRMAEQLKNKLNQTNKAFKLGQVYTNDSHELQNPVAQE